MRLIIKRYYHYQARLSQPYPMLVFTCLVEIYCWWANGGTLLLTGDRVTHCVPHDNVDVVIKRSVDVLRGVEVEKVTEMVVEIHSCGVCKTKSQTHKAYVTLSWMPVHKVTNKVPRMSACVT